MCTLCERTTDLSFHHLIPRKLHKRKRFAKQYSKDQLNKGLMLCHLCHKGLHRLYNEMELGTRFNTEQTLRNDETIARHMGWVARQKTRNTLE